MVKDIEERIFQFPLLGSEREMTVKCPECGSTFNSPYWVPIPSTYKNIILLFYLSIPLIGFMKPATPMKYIIVSTFNSPYWVLGQKMVSSETT